MRRAEGWNSNWKPAEGHRRATFQGHQWGIVRVRPWASSDKFPSYRANYTLLPTSLHPLPMARHRMGVHVLCPSTSTFTYQAGC